MNDATLSEATRTLKMLNDAVSAGGDFVLDQAPQLAKELVRYEVWSSLSWIIISSIAIFLVIKYSWKWARGCNDDIAFVIPVFCLFVCVPMFLLSLQSEIKALTAPRLIILDYVRDAIKSTK